MAQQQVEKESKVVEAEVQIGPVHTQIDEPMADIGQCISLLASISLGLFLQNSFGSLSDHDLISKMLFAVSSYKINVVS